MFDLALFKYTLIHDFTDFRGQILIQQIQESCKM